MAIKIYFYGDLPGEDIIVTAELTPVNPDGIECEWCGEFIAMAALALTPGYSTPLGVDTELVCPKHVNDGVVRHVEVIE